jgi:hypothetical protein
MFLTNYHAFNRGRKFRMALFDKMARRLGLMDRMAATVGADVRDAGPATYREAVVRCSQCVHPAECTAFLQQNKATSGDAAKSVSPDFCRNKQLLDRLAASSPQ